MTEEIARRSKTTLKEKIGNITYITFYDRIRQTIVTKAIIKNTKEGLGTVTGQVVLHKEDKYDLEKARKLAKAKLMIKISDALIDHYVFERDWLEEIFLRNNHRLRNTIDRLRRYNEELSSIVSSGMLNKNFWPYDTKSQKGSVEYIAYGTDLKDSDALQFTKCIIRDNRLGQKFIGVARHSDSDTFDFCIGGRIAFLRAAIKLNKARVRELNESIKIFGNALRDINKQIGFYEYQSQKYGNIYFTEKYTAV